MKQSEATAFLTSNGDWSATTCGRCPSSLERGGGYRSKPGAPETNDPEGEVDMLCHDCLHADDRTRFLAHPVLRCGSTMAITALIRHDLEVFLPHFEAEIALTPTLQAMWDRYRDHPVLNDPKLKRALLVDTSTGAEHARTWGEEYASTIVEPGMFVVEMFDSMCGYRGLEVYQWGRPEPGMWVQAKVRPDAHEAWLGSTYADAAFIERITQSVRGMLDRDDPNPVARRAAWLAAQQRVWCNMLAYAWPELAAATSLPPVT